MKTDKIPTLRRWFRRLGRAALVLGALLVMAHSAALLVYGRRVEYRLAALKAAGEPIAMADLAARDIPEAENGAVLYARVFALLEGKNPSAGARVDILSGNQAPEAWEAARRAVAAHPEILSLAEDAAARPRCRFPARWQDGPTARLDFLSGMRNLQRALCTRAVLNARDGRMTEAAHALDVAFRVSQSVREEPTLIAFLVRVAMLQIATTSLRQVSAWGEIPVDAAGRLAEDLVQVSLDQGAADAMASERAFGLWFFTEGRRVGPAFLAHVSEEGPSIPPLPSIANRALGYLAGPLLYLDENAYLDVMEQQVRAVRSPWREVQGRSGHELDAVPKLALVTRIVAPAFARVSCTRDRARAEILGSRVLLALVRYHARTGSYPNSLQALAPDLGGEVPADPFTGKPFAYRPEGKGFILYSVGDDLHDDGGRPTKALAGLPGGGISRPGQRIVPAANLDARPRAEQHNVGDLVWRRDR